MSFNLFSENVKLFSPFLQKSDFTINACRACHSIYSLKTWNCSPCFLQKSDFTINARRACHSICSLKTWNCSPRFLQKSDFTKNACCACHSIYSLKTWNYSPCYIIIRNTLEIPTALAKVCWHCFTSKCTCIERKTLVNPSIV